MAHDTKAKIMYEKKNRETPEGKCLECGTALYGRSDKKFCCPNCRSKYNYREIKASNLFRGRVIRSLNSNYRILSRLVEARKKTIGIVEAETIGFKPDVFTYSCRKPNGRTEKRIFDIRYVQTPKRLYNIEKITSL